MDPTGSQRGRVCPVFKDGRHGLKGGATGRVVRLGVGRHRVVVVVSGRCEGVEGVGGRSSRRL